MQYKKIFSIAFILLGIGLIAGSAINTPTNLPIVSYFNDKPKAEAWIGSILFAIGFFMLITKNK